MQGASTVHASVRSSSDKRAAGLCNLNYVISVWPRDGHDFNLCVFRFLSVCFACLFHRFCVQRACIACVTGTFFWLLLYILYRSAYWNPSLAIRSKRKNKIRYTYDSLKWKQDISKHNRKIKKGTINIRQRCHSNCYLIKPISKAISHS